MKIKTTNIFKFLAVVISLIMGASPVLAANYYMANGGSYWTQSGSGWTYTNNDGYCISGRGPCGSSLWYFQSNYNHGGCGFDANARWDMASVVPYNGTLSTWIDYSGGGTMYGAGYDVYYGSSGFDNTNVNLNQNNYGEEFAPLGTYFEATRVYLSDGWSNQYACNGNTGYRVEWDEMKLSV